MINDHLFPPPILRFIFIINFCIFIVIPSSYSDDDDLHEQYVECSRPFQCGPEVREIRYPFWGGNRSHPYCGRQEFLLNCHENDQHTTIESESQTFRVLRINSDQQTVKIAREDLWDDFCFERLDDTAFDQKIFTLLWKVENRNLSVFYDCNDASSDSRPNKYNCSKDGEERIGFYKVDGEEGLFQNVTDLDCKGVIKVPILWDDALHITQTLRLQGNDWLMEALHQGFEVRYNADVQSCSACLSSRGICGSNSSDSQSFACLCRDEPYPRTCPSTPGPPPTPGPPGNKRDYGLKAGIAVGAVFVGMCLMGVFGFFCIRRTRNQKKYAPSSHVSRSTHSGSSSVLDLEKGDNFHGIPVFTYAELEEATNYFDSTKELGDGGFGTVYHGKLRDGRSVAVKRLYENNYKRVEQFMNEVVILAGLRHQNLVSLYGCTSRHSRELLLVYEYIPNGTVADHLHGERAKPGALPWHTRLKIATETAKALTYLHASDIIHRDVKTNNILLDCNFCVKVADFGLSRLFPTDVTHVSTAPQGTPGYVDPEYHQCYQLTDRSDVFSFGVVLMELISSMPAVDITRHRHEINLSNMAINKIQNKALHELVDPTLGFDSDYKIRKMINAVAELAFRCLQSEKEMRPSMADALETLKGIQNDGYDKEKAEEMDIPADDVGLLKSGSLSMSPDSVTFNWISTKTTPNASS